MQAVKLGKQELINENHRRYLETVALTKMSFARVISHFAGFFLFLIILAAIADADDLRVRYKLLGIVGILLSVFLSIYPWLRDYRRR